MVKLRMEVLTPLLVLSLLCFNCVESKATDIKDPKIINEPGCGWCMHLLSQLGLSTKRSNPDIIKIFKDECKVYPLNTTSDQEMCVAELIRNMHSVRKILDIGASGFGFCVHLKLCAEANYNDKAVAFPFWKPADNKVTITNTGEHCNTCIHLAEAANTRYFKNYTNTDYQDQIIKWCAFLPNEYSKGMCMALADQWKEAWVLHELLLDSHLLCRNMELCNDDQIDDENMIGVHSPNCSECKNTLEYYKEALEIHSFGLDAREQDIAKSTCQEYAEKEKETCEREFLAALPIVMHSVSTFIQPALMCQEFKFCTAKGKEEL